MGRYVLRRLVNAVPLIVGITFISFLVVDLAPGDFFTSLKMNPQISPETLQAMEAKYGFDKPLVVRYFLWFWRVLHFDFGESIFYHVDVLSLIGRFLPNTVILSAAAMVVSWGLAVPLGLFMALRPGTWADRLLSFFAFMGMSIPSFFFALLLLIFALQTGWFPTGGSFSPDYDTLSLAGKVWDRIHRLVLPVVVLGTSGVAGLMRLMRGNVMEIMNADYVRTARAKGLPERVVVFKHILRNAINPFITIAGYELGALFGGAALVEAVLHLQGMGNLMLQAVLSQDLFLLMGSILIGAVLLIVGNLLADIALKFADPRIRYE
ncbi:MAG: ABC transporter permease [Nitrospirae bacterium]|nr:ABC transporter permease [Nitrospirota bacterium]